MQIEVKSGSRSLRAWLGEQAGDADMLLRDLHLDSRCVGEGDAFVAVTGRQADGRDFAAEAVARGAVVILIEGGTMTAELRECGVPVLELPELRQRVGELAARFYRLDQLEFCLVGVTGTNGKTTISHMLAQLLSALGAASALVGTLGWGFEGALCETGVTTPDEISTARIVNRLARDGAEYIAMEVSSHGLAQHRTEQLAFDVAVFSNLSRDHLDFHRDMGAYAESKRRLFLGDVGLAVINIDDDFGQKLVHDAEISASKRTYSMANPLADVFCRNPVFDASGSRATVVTPWGEGELICPLPGAFNILNLLACITVLGDLGYELEQMLPCLEQAKGAPGRMERVHAGDVMVVVDYAHTPDALEQALGGLRPHVEGCLWVVFGCGGNRDVGKRPLMGAVAATFADRVVLTNDNSRDEAPEAIAAAILAGIAGIADETTVEVELERGLAIRQTLARAQAGDVVLIAGKGHEDYQEIQGVRRPFSDRGCVERYYVDAAVARR